MTKGSRNAPMRILISALSKGTRRPPLFAVSARLGPLVNGMLNMGYSWSAIPFISFIYIYHESRSRCS